MLRLGLNFKRTGLDVCGSLSAASTTEVVKLDTVLPKDGRRWGADLTRIVSACLPFRIEIGMHK